MEFVESCQLESVNITQYIQSAQIVLSCSPFDETLAFFTDRLGFRVDIVSPADDPAVVMISGHGLNIRLERNTGESIQSAGTIRLLLAHGSGLFANEITELFAPNGTKIQLVEATAKLVIPSVKQSFVVTKMNTDAQWVKGRAGMNYRDLIPGRQGGRFIASHIQIPNGGPVPDHVHYHDVRFQMIYVYKGWARLVYENQGYPFVLHAGDCVLQPPRIRHRVLESSGGLEVIEMACPAVHNTYIDHNIELPTANELPDYDYGGQRFVKYVAMEENAEWQPWRLPGFEFRDTGIAAATEDLAGVRIIRSNGDVKPQMCEHDAEFVFMFLLTGELSLLVKGRTIEKFTAGDTFVMPEKLSHAFVEWSEDVQLLEVSLPGTFATIYV
ncbi:unnamed protein product [Didymodactylos carnosus]|uniref:Cupin type-2 domain-containing protein n=1 Tax=Didymodactylos carnosus TaxID=1234261 RepID=A0A815QPC3_9BILA|nr:unnamed protein product [Didymodactylos carnosus]CAF4335136.1 unnamed protein product [Didymodactylos carnosus]